jgi:phosphoribosyl-ATP pyrophosphohydrolase/phosphoribosyl-AMP cyclohydrolase
MLKTVNWTKMKGLLPAIIQDAVSGKMLMLGYMNEAALAQTLETRKVTFYSRSKARLWVKGETSGNTLTLIDVRLDCDQDALLVLAQPEGPTCHKGWTSCFSDDIGASMEAFAECEHTICKRRQEADTQNSYTAQLFAQGPERIAQKIGEEGVEVSLAVAKGNKDEVCSEAADLLFHLMVGLVQSGCGLSDVAHVLQARRKLVLSG